jgi:hypothetical protein
MAYNFCWFSGTVLQSGFSKTGDWTYAIGQLNIGSARKPVLLVAGIIAYLVSLKLVRLQANRFEQACPAFPLKRNMVYAYLAVAMAATVSGLFFQQNRTDAALEGFLEAIGLLPILFVIPGKQTKASQYEMNASPVVTTLVFVLFIAFCFTLGKGLS